MCLHIGTTPASSAIEGAYIAAPMYITCRTIYIKLARPKQCNNKECQSSLKYTASCMNAGLCNKRNKHTPEVTPKKAPVIETAFDLYLSRRYYQCVT